MPKKVNGETLFFVGTEQSNKLHVFDANFKPLPAITLNGVANVIDLASSRFDKDTRIYFCESTEGGRNSILGYYDVQSKQVTRDESINCGIVNVSADGRWLSCYQRERTELVRRTGNKLAKAESRFTDPENGRFLKDRYTYHDKICTIDGLITLQRVPGRNYTEFTKRPLGICWSPEQLSILSSNDYRVLAQFPLSTEWQALYRVSAPPGNSYRFTQCDLFADDQRMVALGRIRQQLFLAGLGDMGFPEEPDLRPTNPISDSMLVGQQLLTTLGLPSGTQLQPLRSSSGLEWPDGEVATSIAGGSTRASSMPRLMNDVSASDSAINFRFAERRWHPHQTFKLRIDQEVMAVSRVEGGEMDINGKREQVLVAVVSRPNPQPHTKDALAEVVVNEPTPIDPANIPMTKDDKVAWRPAPGVCGVQYLRLLARSGETTREILQRIDITLPKRELPYVIYGLSVDRDNETALIWGRDKGNGTTLGKWKASIVDLTGKAPDRTIDVNKSILSGCVDKRAFYLAIDGQERPMPVYLDSNFWNSNERSEIQAYDINKMTPLKKVATTDKVIQLESLAGKYLIANKTLTLVLPDMKPIPNRNTSHPTTFNGRVGDGWLFDGVLYDKDMVKPKLLVHPTFNLNSSSMRPASTMRNQSYDVIERVGGPQFQMINPRAGRIEDLGAPLSRLQGGVRIDTGWLRISGFPPANGAEFGMGQPITLAQCQLFKPRYQGSPYWIQGEFFPIGASNENFVCGYWDELWTAPMASLMPRTESFQFPQQQDKFILNAHKPNTLNFSVENAQSYDLAFFNAAGFSEPLLSLHSDTGKFEFEFDEKSLVDIATFEIKRVARSNGAGTNEMDSRPYEKLVADATQAYAGKKLNGVGIPIYACVTATHKDGKNRCILTHFYMVDVSNNAINKAAPRPRPGTNPGMNRRS